MDVYSATAALAVYRTFLRSIVNGTLSKASDLPEDSQGFPGRVYEAAFISSTAPACDVGTGMCVVKKEPGWPLTVGITVFEVFFSVVIASVAIAVPSLCGIVVVETGAQLLPRCVLWMMTVFSWIEAIEPSPIVCCRTVVSGLQDPATMVAAGKDACL